MNDASTVLSYRIHTGREQSFMPLSPMRMAMDGFSTYERYTTPGGNTAFRTVEDKTSSDVILVLDTETTGLYGAPKDLVVDIGICEMSLEDGTVKELFSSVLGYDTTYWDDYLKNAWIFQNTDMTLEMVEDAPPAMDVIDKVRRLVRGRMMTAYNVDYDFGKFLYEEPWSMRGLFVECNDIMKAAKDVCKLPSEMYGGDYRYPKLDYAYSHIVKGDPAGIHGVQNHRALSDAFMASYLAIEMHRNHQYYP